MQNAQISTEWQGAIHILLHCSFEPPAYNGPSKEEVYRLRKQHLSPGAHMTNCTAAARMQHTLHRSAPLSSMLERNEIICQQLTVMPAAMFHHFKDPVMIVDGKMQYLFDETGRRYLDVRGLLL